MPTKLKPLCKICESPYHYQTFCPRKAKKRIAVFRRIPKKGRRQLEYEEWRDTVAKPYLDATFGHKCARCGQGDYGLHILEVDHIKNRGSHPELIMELSNVQWLGRVPCHQDKTDGR